jgi:glucose/arabinose dehydrogenase
MIFLPGGDILVTERPGRLRLISDGKLQDEPIAGTPEVQTRNHGGPLEKLYEEQGGRALKSA